MDSTKKIYLGGCHCKAVRFEVLAGVDLTVWKCNCSTCLMKQNHHFIVPNKYFKLLSGEGNLTLYTFNTHTAKHYFCKTCGVQSFYNPRSNPDGVAVTIYCLDQETKPESIKIIEFDGQNWEKEMQNKAEIKKCSESND